jgi:hypothetical protein
MFLSASEIEKFHKARIVFSTLDKTYCSNPECAEFILPAQIMADHAYCKICGSETCVHCKQYMHSGDCPEDDDLNAIIQLAQDEGWRRCHSCKAMVELTYGCNHMT